MVWLIHQSSIIILDDCCKSDHPVFLMCLSSNKYIILMVYVDDIRITNDDHEGIK